MIGADSPHADHVRLEEHLVEMAVACDGILLTRRQMQTPVDDARVRQIDRLMIHTIAVGDRQHLAKIPYRRDAIRVRRKDRLVRLEDGVVVIGQRAQDRDILPSPSANALTTTRNSALTPELYSLSSHGSGTSATTVCRRNAVRCVTAANMPSTTYSSQKVRRQLSSRTGQASP